ncbi:MAG: dephospho-CoA kinase [Pseudomonadota bacterium]
MSRANAYRLGLTGSIGMGKSTTAKLFADEGIPVWDADDAVHRLYGRNGRATEAIADLVPSAIVDGAVDRDRLKAEIAADPALLAQIEAIVHPLVRQDRIEFDRLHTKQALLLFDIPLLYETGGEDWLDGVLVVTAPKSVQEDRVMARAGMTRGHFETILARQMPDSEKRARADFVIDTQFGVPAAHEAVRAIISKIYKIQTRNAHA